MSIYRNLLLVALALGLYLPLAAADTLRCQTNVVDRGFSSFEVLERCGSPVQAISYWEYRYPGIYIRVDDWLYEFGSNKFRRLLRFENGELTSIKTRTKPLVAARFKEPRPYDLSTSTPYDSPSYPTMYPNAEPSAH